MKKIILLLLFILNCQYIIGQFISAHSVATISANATEVRFSMDTNGASSRAILRWAVFPAAATTGSSMNYQAPGGGSILPGTLTMQDTNIFTLVGLPLGTTYNYTIQITPILTTNVIHSVNGTFTTRTASDVTNVTANPVTSTTATINYSINANGAATTPVVSYGTTSTTLGTSVNGTVVTGTTPTTGSVAITGLLSGTTYHYRVSGNSVAGTGQSPIQTFTTASIAVVPLISAVSTGALTSSSAVINYSINAGGTQTSPIIRYSTNTANVSNGLGSTQTCAVVNGTTATAQTQSLTSLVPNTQYFYRVEATNSAGNAINSNVFTFTTPAATAVVPAISAVSTGTLTSSTAIINYSISAGSATTTPIIRYSTSSANVSSGAGSTQICAQVNGTAATAQTQSLTSLTANTTYFYRVEASNTVGSATPSIVLSFTTSAAPQSIQPTATSPQIFCSGATVASLLATGNDIKWYANATGGSPLAGSTVLVAGIYYVTQTLANATESTRRSVSVNITTVDAPLVPNALFLCAPATVAQLTAVGTGTLEWFNVATGGTALAASTPISSNGNFYVQQTIGNCTSTRTNATVFLTVVTTTGNPNQTFSQGATIASLVTSGIGSGVVDWFTSAANATANTSPLATGTVLTNNTTYYAVQTLGNCRSTPPLAVTATVTPATTAPAITALTTASVVPSFESAQVNFNLNAFGSVTTYVVEYSTDVIAQFWPAVSGVTTSVNTPTAFTVQIPGLISRVQYFVRVRATNAANQVTVSNAVSFTTLNPIAVTNLGNNTITATTAQINYTLNTNGISAIVKIAYQARASFDSDLPFTLVDVSNFAVINTPTNYNYTLTGLTPNTLYSYKLLVSTSGNGGFESGQNAAFTTSNPQSPLPTAATPQTFCDGATVASLMATGNNIKWYANASGGSQLATTTLLTPTTYYVTQTQPNLAESARLAVGVNITVVNAPTAQAQSFCNSATVANLTATGTGTIAWFNVATGGTALANNTALATGTYFVSQTIGSCTSTRTAVAVTINVVNPPQINPTFGFCNATTVASLFGNGTDIKWYDVATGGTALSNTAALMRGTYFASQTINGCESNRTSFFVDIVVVNAPTAQAQSFCNSATVQSLTPNNPAIPNPQAPAFRWYNVATGGTALTASTALASGIYYVSQISSTCESPRTAVVVTVNAVNAPTGSATQIVAAGATIANLNATGSNVVWFASAANAAANINPLPATTLLVNSTTYFAMQTVGTCRSSASLAVTATVSLSASDFDLGLQFNMYPNPATNAVNIEVASELKSVEIYSLQGQKVLSSSSKELNVSDLSSGVYLIRVEDTNGAIATKRLIKK